MLIVLYFLGCWGDEGGFVRVFRVCFFFFFGGGGLSFLSFCCCSLLFLFVVYWCCVVVLLLLYLKPFSAACNKRAYRSRRAGTFLERVTGVVGVQVLVVCRHIGKPAGGKKQRRFLMRTLEPSKSQNLGLWI